MRSPTIALLWDIWRRNHRSVWVIVGLTVFSWLVDFSETRPEAISEPTLLNELLGMISFIVLFGIFNYTEFSRDSGLARFPPRLFTLPVSSLRLVAVPVVAGIASVELLYLMWMARLSRGGPTSPLFIGVLLAAFIVFYQAALWTLARLGPLRLVVLGMIGIALFGISLLPSFPPSPPPLWRSETALTVLIAGMAVVVFLLAWGHVVRLRSGGGRGQLRLVPPVGRVADAWPRRRRGFASPAAAHFWFEWRCSGLALPALVGGLLLVVIVPFSWAVRHDPGNTLQLLLGTLAAPIILAIPAGLAFSRPTLWSDDLALPAFIAVRPLSADDVVAIKVRVAAASVAVSWLVLILFLGVWLPLWANLDSASRLVIQLRAIHHQSLFAVYGIAALIVIAGMFLTWRFLVTSLWSGLSGSRSLFILSAAPPALVAIAWAVFNGGRLPGWLLEDPARLIPLVWILALAVTVKYSFAAYSWRRIAPRLVRQYLLVWIAGTACFVMLAGTLWGLMRIDLPTDFHRLQSVLILTALLVVPLGRVGLAPSFLSGNRHRRR